MKEFEIETAIEHFMRPVLYTGVNPLFLIAEELATQSNIGDIVEAVWLQIDSYKEFRYISKFAVQGKIELTKYYEPYEVEPFKGRVALANRDNVQSVILHRECKREIEELKAKRASILQSIHKNFEELEDLYLQNQEIYLFKKKDGDWEKEFFSDFNIDSPLRVKSVQRREKQLQLYLKHPQRNKLQKQTLENIFGYFVGSQADIKGLKLKSESYLQSILALETEAKKHITSIEWLSLDDAQIVTLSQELPSHPFENYFAYTPKEAIKKLDVSQKIIDALKKIILKHMPETNTPLGMTYIQIDKLLYLFHMIIPREKALIALESCDVVYEPPGVVLGHSGQRKLPAKYLVPIEHVAHAYKQFPDFVSVCQNY